MTEAVQNPTPENVPAPDTGAAPEQAPAPATQPAAAPVPTEPPALPTPEVEEFPATGDAALDVSLAYAAQQGLKKDSPEITAAQEGDFSKLEAYMKGRNAPGWERHLELAKGAHTRVIEAQRERIAGVTKLVHEVSGGEAAWKEASAAVAANATAAERDEINAALAKGGLSARMAAQHVIQTYRQTAGKPAGDPAGSAPAGSSGPAHLTSREYAREVEKLANANRGKHIEALPAYRELNARRLASRAAGVK